MSALFTALAPGKDGVLTGEYQDPYHEAHSYASMLRKHGHRVVTLEKTSITQVDVPVPGPAGRVMDREGRPQYTVRARGLAPMRFIHSTKGVV